MWLRDRVSLAVDWSVTVALVVGTLLLVWWGWLLGLGVFK